LIDVEKIKVKYFIDGNGNTSETETLIPCIIKCDEEFNWIEQDGKKFEGKNCSQNPQVRGLVGGLFKKNRICSISLQFDDDKTIDFQWTCNSVKTSKGKRKVSSVDKSAITYQATQKLLIENYNLLASHLNIPLAKPSKKEDKEGALPSRSKERNYCFFKSLWTNPN